MTSLTKLPLNLLITIFEGLSLDKLLLLFKSFPTLNNILYPNETFWMAWYLFHYPDKTHTFLISTPWRDVSLSSPTFHIPLLSPTTTKNIEYSQVQNLGSGLTVEHGLETASICNLRYDWENQLPVLDRDTLESYAAMYNISYTGVPDMTLIELIMIAAPCSWISSVEAWAKRNTQYAKALNTYSTDMSTMSKVRKGEILTSKEEIYYQILKEAILNSPLTDQEFAVYRGNYQSPGTFGTEVTYSYPVSGSFSFVPIYSAYVNDSISKIIIPKGSVLSYHPSEDQVIFPAGAKFRIISGSISKSHLVFGQIETYPEYELVYKGVI